MPRNLLTRRQIFRNAAGLSALIAAPSIIPRSALGQPAFDWKRFAGSKIDVALVRNPRNEILTKNLAEFSQLTGIEASLETIPEQQYRQKLVIEFASGRPTFDVAELTLTVQKRLAARGRWFTDLHPIIADTAQTAPDFDFADFSKGAIAASTQADGTLDTLPAALDYFMLYYNKELFAARNIQPPTSMEQLVDVAAKLNNPGKRVSGFVSRGLKNANVPVWTSLLFGQDANAVDQNLRLQTETPEAIWAANLYKTLNREYGPPGVVGFNWNECQTTFSQGFAAMWLDSTAWAKPLENPATSKIAGKVGYMPVPPGPKAQASAVFSSGIGIVSQSEKKGPAWFFVQWANNKQNQARLLQTGVGSPARVSPFQDRALQASSSLPSDYFETMLKCMEIGREALPNIIPVTEFRDVFGVALANMISGGDPAAELAKATATFRPILADSEK